MAQEKKEEANQDYTKVVAALIEKDGKYLLAKRLSGAKELIGKWEFPGGKVEPGETDEQALEREIKEEFNIEIEATKFLMHNICEYPDKVIDLKLYKCKYVSGEFRLQRHSEYVLVEKDQLFSYELCPADVILAEYVKDNQAL